MDAMQVTIFFIVLPSMLAVIYLTRASIRVLVGKQSALRWMSLLTVYMCCYQYLLVPQIRAQFPYDVPAVAVFAIAFYAILLRKWWMYYPLFVVGTLNRETTLFLIPVFVLLQLREDLPLLQALRVLPRRIYVEAALQFAAWAGIIHWCNVTTNAKLGPTYQLAKNLHFLPNPFHWPTFLSVYGFLWLPVLLFFRHIRHTNLQRIALLFPFWFAAMVWKADLLEIRVQSEWVPYMTICLALIVRNTILLRTDLSAGSAAAPAGTIAL